MSTRCTHASECLLYFSGDITVIWTQSHCTCNTGLLILSSGILIGFYFTGTTVLSFGGDHSLKV